MDRMTVGEVEDWLLDKGFAPAVVDAFADQEMDGLGVVQTFGTCSGPDCLKEIISKYGTRVKVYMAIKSYLETDIRKEDEQVTVASSKEYDSLSSCGTASLFSERTLIVSEGSSSEVRRSVSCVSSIMPAFSYTMQSSAPSTSGHDETSSSQHCGASEKAKMIAAPQSVRVQSVVPNPFPIPTFRETTEKNLADGHVFPDDRKYIVCTLATMLLTYIQRPSMNDCGIVAQSLFSVNTVF